MSFGIQSTGLSLWTMVSDNHQYLTRNQHLYHPQNTLIHSHNDTIDFSFFHLLFMNVLQILSWAEGVLSQAGVSTPRVDAEWILVSILQCRRSELILHPVPSPQQVETYRNLITQRSKRIPLQHLLGETEFYGLPFKTTPEALIPRPDTETLIETVVSRLKDHPAPTLLDIGTGSGIVAITLAHELPHAHVFAIDIAKPPLKLAHQNAYLNRVSQRIYFVQSNLFSALTQMPKFDAIVSNPPYIPTQDILSLEPEVQNHDPHLALDGGSDGLSFYRKIIPQSITRLTPGGILALEIGYNQANAVSRLIEQHPQWGPISAHKDLFGHTRVLVSQKRK
jgi:release factor glutamine methyltransferase